MDFRSEQVGWFLEQEARALLTRLNMLHPYALFETMVPAAAPRASVAAAVHAYMASKTKALRSMVLGFLAWLGDARARGEQPATMQQRFTLLRLQFNALMTQFDIFADVITQRSEHQTGVWLAGLDWVATDALRLPGGYYQPPPVVCYLDRGHGAAIRRARTRLPGGGDNPVAVIRVPRERMVGSGIASSLVHEVGHQGAALLDLVTSLRGELRAKQRVAGEAGAAWRLYERWVSEIVADFWSVAKVGVASTMGLIGVVSLPRAFVFRIAGDDPHPAPWIRVMLSAKIGSVLYPGPQWSRIGETWNALYPVEGVSPQKRALFDQLLSTMDDFVLLLVNHRPRSMRGRSLGEVLSIGERTPARLEALWSLWRAKPEEAHSAPPTVVFAAIGQARANGGISPEQESQLLSQHLSRWAMQAALDSTARCADDSGPAPRTPPWIEDSVQRFQRRGD